MSDVKQETPNEFPYGGVGDVQSDTSAAINLALVWLTVRRWWLVCLPIGLVLAAAGCALVWITFEPVYESVGYLRIESTNPYIVYREDQPGMANWADRTVRTQVELLRSPIILESVLERKEIAAIPAIRALANPIRDLAKKIKINSENDSELYSVTYSAPDRNDACAVVNAIMDEYIKHQEKEIRGRNEFLINLLLAEIAQRKTEVAAKKNLVREMASKVPGSMVAPDVAPEQLDERAQANQWASQLAATEVERAVVRAMIKALEQSVQVEEVTIPDATLDEVVANAPEIQQLTAELQQAKAAQAGIREGSSLAAQYRTKIANLERQLTLRSGQIRDEMRASELRRHRAVQSASVASRIAELEAQLAAYDGTAEYLTKRLAEYQERLSGSTGRAMELEFAQRELVRAEDVFERLNQRVNELRTETRAPARVTPLKVATPANSPVEILPLRQFSAVSLAALALPFCLALLWEFRSQRVAGSRQIQHALNLPVLAEVTSLPRYPRLTNRNASDSYQAQRAAFENSIHYLCRNLLLSAEHSDSRVFAVTSAVSGEGKTNLASVLSISMALASHESVLLIDGDMRRPDVHAMFDLEQSPGLAELLGGTCTQEEAIHETLSEGVFVMPAGRLGAHPHSVLRKDKFVALLDRLRTQFRYVIVDTPPVLSVGETLSVCNLVDGVILCAMRDVSLRPQIEEAYNRLNATGANTFGVVLNGVSVKTYASRYGSYYHTQRSAV